MSQILNQVIVNKNGNSWLGVHLSGEMVDYKLGVCQELLDKYKSNNEEWANAVWVFDKEMKCVSASRTLEDAIKHYNPARFLVHGRPSFLFNKNINS